jgi:hypothetical protein
MDPFSSPSSSPEPPLPPAPPLWSFLEYSAARLFVEALIGAGVGWLLAGNLPMVLGEGVASGAGGGAGTGAGWALAGAILAPLALMLTPTHGARLVRAFRYGLALAVMGTLVLSFTGPGRDRPLEELVLAAIFLGCVGAAGHGLFLMTVRDGGSGVAQASGNGG